jgi:hypothetical protein
VRGAQPPNSDANSRLEVDGSGLPGRTTVDSTGGLEAVVEVVANSVRLVVEAWWRAMGYGRFD